jgi:Tfp pilus assembly protein PilZ
MIFPTFPEMIKITCTTIVMGFALVLDCHSQCVSNSCLNVGHPRSSLSANIGISIRPESSWGTNFVYGYSGHSNNHALLFNAYQPVNLNSAGNLEYLGNLKYSVNEGSFVTGAAAISYQGNGGFMNFLISESAGQSGINTNVIWGEPVLSLTRSKRIGVGIRFPDNKLHLKDLAITGPLVDVQSQLSVIPSNSEMNFLAKFENLSGSVYFDDNIIASYTPSNTTSLTNSLFVGSVNNNTVLFGKNKVGLIISDNDVQIKTRMSIGTDKYFCQGLAKDFVFAVKGGIISDEIRVSNIGTQSSWPDYVFNKEYSLNSLKMHKEYIQNNNHLMFLNSAEFYYSEGLDIVEFNKGVLRNLEELLLHIIKLEERINKLENDK